jgi:hypothetical protein
VLVLRKLESNKEEQEREGRSESMVPEQIKRTRRQASEIKKSRHPNPFKLGKLKDW